MDEYDGLANSDDIFGKTAVHFSYTDEKRNKENPQNTFSEKLFTT